MSETETASALLRPDGGTLLTPALGDPDRFSYRVALEGVIFFRYTGERFDALYRSRGDGVFDRRHDYLRWTPRTPVLQESDPARHRYLFRIPPEWKLAGQSVGVRVDLDRLIDVYLIPLSEVRSQLEGELRMTVLQTSLVPPSPWPLIAWSSLPAAAVIGGAAFAIRRRMAFRGLSDDLRAALLRLEPRFRAARASIPAQHDRLFPIRERLAALREGAYSLAREIQQLRNARQMVDRCRLDREVGLLRARLITFSDAAAKSEAETALAEKRRSLELLDEMEQGESRRILRLAKMEAVLDSTCLTLQSVAVGSTESGAAQALRRDLDAEVAAIREVMSDD